MTNKNPFGDFTGTAVGEAEQVKWEFPGMGYNASQGIIYVNEDQVNSMSIVPLALRQCKEVEDVNGVTHRYPVNMPKAKIVSGDVTYRLQIACVYNEQIFVFGARSWTARASWLNPRGGQWRDEKFATGIWYQLDDWIKEQKAKHGVSTTPLCWQLEIAPGAEVTVGTGKNTAKSKPLQMQSEPVFVGAEKVAEYEELYTSEDLSGWIEEWRKVTTEAAAVEDNEPPVSQFEDLPEGIPF